jgi:ABC-type multidrug transport system fused ATPase/permease subunit
LAHKHTHPPFPFQVCAFVGKSGCGKSTLINLLMRFYDPREGRIVVDGCDIKDYNLASYHKHIAAVSQDTQLFRCSIEENIAYGVESYTPEELVEAATMANAHGFITELPDGYATRIGERGMRLSGGQRQRLAIARAFLRKPKILLLDEATSALDAESEAQVQEALDRLISKGNQTVILVAHRLSTVINADKIVVISDGGIAEEGNHDQLLQLDGIYARLVKRQIEKQRNVLDNEAATNAAPNDVVDNLM